MTENKSNRIWVGNLGENVQRADIKSEFSKCGTIKAIWLVFHKKMQSLRFVYV